MIFCKHEWKVLHTTPIYYKETFQYRYGNGNIVIGEHVICTCDKCGNIKKFTNN